MALEYKYSLTYKGINRYNPPADSPEAEIMDYMKAVDTEVSATEVVEDLGYGPEYVPMVRKLLDQLNQEGALLKTFG